MDNRAGRSPPMHGRGKLPQPYQLRQRNYWQTVTVPSKRALLWSVAEAVILFRYLAKEVLSTTAAVTVLLLVIVVSGRFVKYLAQAAAGDLAPNVLLAIIVFRIPSFLELILPLALFIGILLAYGRLYVDSEMTVMSACGISTGRLASYTLVPSALIGVLVAACSLYFSPLGIDQVQRIFRDTSSSQGLQSLVQGRFRVDEGSGRVTYVETMEADGRMRNVFAADRAVVDDDRPQQLAVVVAERGRIEVEAGTGQRFLRLEDGARYLGRPGAADYRVTDFDVLGQRLQAPQGQDYQKQDARRTLDLLRASEPVERATLQWRISLVLLVPVVALLALALSRTDHRSGRYRKMFPGFLLYMVYLVSLGGARDAMGQGRLPAELGLWWVHGLFLVLALALLFGPHWLQTRRGAR